jgi:hypothetical protein
MKSASQVFLLTYLCILAASGYTMGYNMVDGENSTAQLADTKDSRTDGISYETNQATLLMYLREISSTADVVDFSRPGSHQLTLNYESAKTSKTSNVILEHLNSLEIPRDSTWNINFNGQGYRSPMMNSTLVYSVLEKLSNIKTVHWRIRQPIPAGILSLLETNNPSCLLYYTMPFHWEGENRMIDEMGHQSLRMTEDETHASRMTALEPILKSSILYSLDTSIIASGKPRTPSALDLVFRILESCPNIRELTLSVQDGGGCVVYPGNSYSFNFLSSDIVLPPLEVLSIIGYRLTDKPDGQKWMEWEAEHPQRNILKLPWKYLPDSIVN